MKNNNIQSIFFIGLATIIGGGINYLYHPTMLRFLDIEVFAVFGSMVSFLNILGIVTSGILLFLTKQVSTHRQNDAMLSALYKI
jgi:O-antigen/teichoic acid export membrane protein